MMHAPHTPRIRYTTASTTKRGQIFDCAEDFRLADEDRERAVKDTTDRVRMAADEAELKASFDKAMSLLEEARAQTMSSRPTLLINAVIKREERNGLGHQGMKPSSRLLPSSTRCLLGEGL